MEVSVSNSQSIQELPALKLVPYLSIEQDETTKRRAQTRFYEIFKSEIWTFCKNVVKSNFGHINDWEEVAWEIHSEAFRVTLSKMTTFKLEEDCSELKAYNTIRRYIARTANFLILKHISKAVKENENFDKYKEFVELGLDQGESGTIEVQKSYDSKKFNQVWSNFSSLSKEIVLLCFEHDSFPTIDKKNKKHLPADVLEYLCKKYEDTNNDNIRAAKSRAFKKILECKIT